MRLTYVCADWFEHLQIFAMILFSYFGSLHQTEKNKWNLNRIDWDWYVNCSVLNHLMLSLLLFTLTSWAWAAVSILLFVMFRVFHRLRTSHPPRCTLCKSWTRDPVRRHCGSIRWALRQNCVSLLGNTDYCRWHRHICKSRGQHSVDRRFWSYETVNGNREKVHGISPHILIGKMVCNL